MLINQIPDQLSKNHRVNSARGLLNQVKSSSVKNVDNVNNDYYNTQEAS